MSTDTNTVLKSVDAQAALVTDEYNIRYISGFTGGEATLYISPEHRILITDSRYTEAASKESDFEVIEWNRQRRTEDILAEYILSDSVRCIAYEDKSMLCGDFAKLAEKLDMIERWVPAGSAFNNLRMIKKPWELECLRKAESIGDAAFANLLKIIKEGMTELDVVAELEYQMRKCGGQGTSFDTIAASGLNSSMPHAVPSEKKLQIGKADEKQKELYNLVLRANLEAEAALHAGLRGCEVDKVARDIIDSSIYKGCFGHGLGHSVGLFIHENPRLSPGDSTVLQPGMIETVEPGIYVPGFGGVRIEDMVIVTENGFENLAHSPKELIEI